MKKAIITGVTGQMGSYLAEYLIFKGYNVAGVHRRSSTVNTWRLGNILDNKEFVLEEGDITDPASIRYLLDKYNPEIYMNCAAQSHVHESWFQPCATIESVFKAVSVLLNECVGRGIRIWQASSSEMWGSVSGMQDENTPLNPNSPYAISKAAAHQMCKAYRNGKDVNVSCGILCNYESPRRGDTFVTQKIAKGVNQIKRGEKEYIELGNINAERDWGYAPCYAIGAYKMLQVDPDDFVLATGECHSIKEFVNVAASKAGVDAKIKINPAFIRPQEVPHLCGNYAKARDVLLWEPGIHFDTLIGKMVEADGKLDKIDWTLMEQFCLDYATEGKQFHAYWKERLKEN